MHDLLLVSQIVGSIATPLVVLFLGLRINRQLEKSKLSLSKEREWQAKWADEFILRANAFNNAIEDFALSIFLLGQQSSSPDDPRTSKMNEMVILTWDTRDRVQRAQWSLKVYLQFIPNHGDAVLTAASKVFELVQTIAKEKKGGLDAVNSALFQFNSAVKDAHRELLAIEY